MLCAPALTMNGRAKESPPARRCEWTRRGCRHQWTSTIHEEGEGEQTSEEAPPNAHSTQVEVEVHQEDDAGGIEERTYDNQEAIDEANKDESSSIHDDAFNASPPPTPPGPRAPNAGRVDPRGEDQRREEAA